MSISQSTPENYYQSYQTKIQKTNTISFFKNTFDNRSKYQNTEVRVGLLFDHDLICILGNFITRPDLKLQIIFYRCAN
jgi:hypothetical protein